MSPAPVSVTILLRPASFVSKVAMPPSKLTSSTAKKPVRPVINTTAPVVPSYTLLSATKLPVIPKAVMSAVVVPTDNRL